MINIYYDYESVSSWLKNEVVDNGTAYDRVRSGYEITVENVQDNKIVADNINDKDNGGVGSNVHFYSSGNKNEGYSASSVTVAFKTIFAQLIMIAQLVISLFIIVALVVSSIMTAIVLYSSVVERKTEIGIIKAVGGRNKDVLRIFESEAILMGAFSGILGIIVAYICKPIIEYFIVHYFHLNLPDIVSIPISKMPFINITFPFATFVSLIAFSALISAIAGRLPSKKATKMHVIDALRDE
jgi:ABC-type antimicrobial peptide transport system permease subunit